MGWVASSESEFWWGSKTYKVTSHIIHNSLWQKVLFATKEDLIKRMASDVDFWTCGEVVAQAALMGRKPLWSRRYRQFTAVHHGMHILTTSGILVLFPADSGLTEDFQMCILGHIFGSFIGSIAVDYVVTAFVLCAKEWDIGWSTLRSACFRSVTTWLRCSCIHHFVVWNSRRRRLRKEGGSPEEYIVKFMSEWSK